MITPKEINIKNRLYQIPLNDAINIKNIDPILLSIDKISFKRTDSVIYNIKFINHVNIDNEYFPCLIFNNLDGHIEESSGDKYFVFAFTDKNKEVLTNYTKLWDEIKNQIKTINGDELIEYKKDFKSDDYLTLGKILSIFGMIIVVTSVLQDDNNHYPQIFLDKLVYESVGELQSMQILYNKHIVINIGRAFVLNGTKNLLDI